MGYANYKKRNVQWGIREASFANVLNKIFNDETIDIDPI